MLESVFFDTIALILLKNLSKFIDMYINLFDCSRLFIYQKCQSLSCTMITDEIDPETNLFFLVTLIIFRKFRVFCLVQKVSQGSFCGLIVSVFQ